jgi:Flp pilus assembly pilin Flp
MTSRRRKGHFPIEHFHVFILICVILPHVTLAMVVTREKMVLAWKRSAFLADECGNTAVEYAVICGLISTVSISALVALGESTKNAFEQARSALQTDAEPQSMASEAEAPPKSEQATQSP